MLQAEDLLVFYENALAVNNVSLEIQEGQVVGLLGSNGAGKSTMLYALAGILLERAKREERRGGERITLLGSVRLEGEDITYLGPCERVARGVVLCPERRRVFAECSVLENLRIGAYRRPRAEFGKSLETVWQVFPALHEMRRRRAGLLSGGQQQLLAIARALMAHPRLFLVDEPLLGLAVDVQPVVIEAIRAIAERGVTVFVAEQYARPVLPIVQRAYVIESGSITLSGTREALMRNPHVRAAYFGA